MDQGKLTLYHFAKLTNEELLLQGILQTKRQYPTKFLEKYRKKPNHFKIKVIATKILYSIILNLIRRKFTLLKITQQSLNVYITLIMKRKSQMSDSIISNGFFRPRKHS